MDIEDRDQSSEPVQLDYAAEGGPPRNLPRSIWSILGTIATCIFALIVLAGAIYLFVFLYAITHLAP